MNSRTISVTLMASGWVILLVSAVGKLWGLLWPAKGTVSGLDPLLGIPTASVMLTAAVLELAACCAFLKLPDTLRALVLMVFGVEFFLYHVMLRLAGYRGRCPCFGGLWVWTGLPESGANQVAFWLSAWLVVGGLIALGLHVRRPCSSLTHGLGAVGLDPSGTNATVKCPNPDSTEVPKHSRATPTDVGAPDRFP